MNLRGVGVIWERLIERKTKTTRRDASAVEGEYNCKLESSECGALSKSPDAASAATVATAVAEMAMTGIVPVGHGICDRPPTLRVMLTGRVAKMLRPLSNNSI